MDSPLAVQGYFMNAIVPSHW